MTDAVKAQMAAWGKQGGLARNKVLTDARKRAIGRLGGLAKAKAARQRAKGTGR